VPQGEGYPGESRAFRGGAQLLLPRKQMGLHKVSRVSDSSTKIYEQIDTEMLIANAYL